MTRLRVRYRVVRGDDAAVYKSAWNQLVAAVRSSGGRAWVFQSTDVPGRYIEFIEYAAGQESAIDSGTMLAERRLEMIAANTPAGTWEDGMSGDEGQ